MTRSSVRSSSHGMIGALVRVLDGAHVGSGSVKKYCSNQWLSCDQRNKERGGEGCRG